MRYGKNKTTLSPYAKYGKRPYRYSGYYTNWHDSALKYGLYDQDTIDDDEKFRAYHNLPKRIADDGSFASFADRL